MTYFPVSQSLTRNVKIASFKHPISRAEAGLLDNYKESLDRLKQIKQEQEKSSGYTEVLEECCKSEQLALETVHSTISRMQESNYGLCQTCNKRIEERRLTILPEIKHCFDCSH